MREVIALTYEDVFTVQVQYWPLTNQVLRHCYCPLRIHTPYTTPSAHMRHGACARWRR